MGNSAHISGGILPGGGDRGRILSALVVEDQTIVRDMLVELLGQDARFAAVSSASSAREASERIAAGTLDLVILDLMLPDGHGLDLVTELREAHRRCRIVVLTAHTVPELVHRSVRLGVHGIVMKGAPLGELRTAIDRVLSGGVHHCPATTSLLHRSIAEPVSSDPLSARQRQILERVARGSSTKEIASELGISEKTVSNHRAAIMERLGIRDVAGLTRYALRVGLIEP